MHTQGNEGTVLHNTTWQLRIVEDIEQFDDSFIDTWTEETPEWRAEEKRLLAKQIEREGVWGFIVERYDYCQHCNRGEWKQEESCWGFVGRDAAEEAGKESFASLSKAGAL